MKILSAAATGLGMLVLGGCAVYDPYPVYQPYPAPPVVVQPRVYGYWGGGYYDNRHWGRHWGGHHHPGRHWGHGHGRGRGHW